MPDEGGGIPKGRKVSTFIYSIEVAQAPNAGPNDPAALRIEFKNPERDGFTDNEFKGSRFHGRTNSDSLFLVKSLAEVNGLNAIPTSDTVLPHHLVAPPLSELLISLAALKAPVIESYTNGYYSGWNLPVPRYWAIEHPELLRVTSNDLKLIDKSVHWDSDHWDDFLERHEHRRALRELGARAAIAASYIISRTLSPKPR